MSEVVKILERVTSSIYSAVQSKFGDVVEYSEPPTTHPDYKSRQCEQLAIHRSARSEYTYETVGIQVEPLNKGFYVWIFYSFQRPYDSSNRYAIDRNSDMHLSPDHNGADVAARVLELLVPIEKGVPQCSDMCLINLGLAEQECTCPETFPDERIDQDLEDERSAHGISSDEYYSDEIVGVSRWS